ncbi:MAG TPA: DNA mismatch repair endonuclease MutL [Phycisphaerales bacterium]|nr:DNA mismatch repair endonuclease MutL [Phycisphaerales bacterium]HIB50789.1 DNA mismatch repair endonuclease MutL [Phycisphaerales bacterium]HIN84170.1 DNA mismatch repair endonuclease MutL [Phycisphaerales bacterium]HIO19712.1 DNA mismatch repair endonuclease MutL [Phycisphaerales bacterium]
MTIRKLPTVLINQIAAGEVVDRPASIVKELIENAIDAGSTRIDIQLLHGGKDLIRVSDNGSGIASEELELAVTPHATSKITEEADLAAIASLGFRGEALASIGSISQLLLRSRQEIAESGTQIEVDGGDLTMPKPVGASVGTTVEVKRLFFNTPARRKFLKSDGAETTRVREVVQRLAASHHDVAFTFRSGDALLLEYPQATSKERILSIFGRELDGELIEIDGSVEGIHLWGLVGKPSVARPTSRHIRVHVNGRTISDSSITHALKEAFRGLIEPKRWPTAALFLEMDPALVDVNVHPQKSEVRFRDKDSIWRLVNKTITNALLSQDIVPAYHPSEQLPSFGSGSHQASFGPTSTPSFDIEQARNAVSGIELPTQATPLPTILGPDAVMQVQKCFLVTQDEQGILIIDQHALHERIMFEELSKRIAEGNLESQRMLVPDSFEADSGQLEALLTHAGLFEKLGIDASASGPASISVYALPTLLVSRNVNGATFIRELLDSLGNSDFPSSEEEALSEILDMMSCKAAIKAGDYLNPRELADLLRKRKEIERGSNCPHGRPTSLRLSIEELEKRFGRR